MSEKKSKISVVIAAFNEAGVMAVNIEKIIVALKDRSDLEWELILVNDGSEDSTGTIIDKASQLDPRVKAAHLWRNFGQGRALRKGFEVSSGDVVVTLDADLSYGPEYIWKLYDALNSRKAEIILASPYCRGGSVKNVPWLRKFLSKWGNRYLAKMSHHDIATSTCVVRAYRREVLDELYLTSEGMELQLEILMKAGSMGYRVREIPADLVWSDTKSDAKTCRRVSKMKILRTIKLYLQMGWLSRPAYVFMFLALMMILAGLYMAVWQFYFIVCAIGENFAVGLRFDIAISSSIESVFVENLYSFMIGGGLIIVGLQFLTFGLLFFQNKFHYDEMYRINQQMLKQKREN